jgi:hypothetical protein
MEDNKHDIICDDSLARRKGVTLGQTKALL